MNIQLDRAVTDIVGATGRKMIEAIIDGETNSFALAKLRDPRCLKTCSEMAPYLEGVFTPLHLYELKQAYQRYLFTLDQISAVDFEIEKLLVELAISNDNTNATSTPISPIEQKGADGPKLSDDESTVDSLFGFAKVDLTKIEGIGPETALVILSEFGNDLSRFPSEKHFCSYLGLSPICDISGGKVLSNKTKKVTNRVSTALRLAANSLRRSKSYLGQKFRNLLARKGPQKAITAMAHKLARIVYALLTKGEAYVSIGTKEQEDKAREGRLRSLKAKAKNLGYQLVETPASESSDSPTAHNSSGHSTNGSLDPVSTPKSAEEKGPKIKPKQTKSGIDSSNNKPKNRLKSIKSGSIVSPDLILQHLASKGFV
jgi:hypothetical protein